MVLCVCVRVCMCWGRVCVYVIPSQVVPTPYYIHVNRCTTRSIQRSTNTHGLLLSDLQIYTQVPVHVVRVLARVAGCRGIAGAFGRRTVPVEFQQETDRDPFPFLVPRAIDSEVSECMQLGILFAAEVTVRFGGCHGCSVGGSGLPRVVAAAAAAVGDMS